MDDNSYKPGIRLMGFMIDNDVKIACVFLFEQKVKTIAYTINELQEVQYFSNEQKEFLKDYQFSYILQNYCDESMQTDDDCGHLITKIAVVENNGYGDIRDIGTIDIATTTFCYDDLIPTLFGNDDVVEHYISSNNISKFPSYCNKTTKKHI